MNDELRKSKSENKLMRSLDRRLIARPELTARLRGMADRLEPSIADGCSADEAEKTGDLTGAAVGGDFIGKWAQGAR
jgi:hypothetical protein